MCCHPFDRSNNNNLHVRRRFPICASHTLAFTSHMFVAFVLFLRCLFFFFSSPHAMLSCAFLCCVLGPETFHWIFSLTLFDCWRIACACGVYVCVLVWHVVALVICVCMSECYVKYAGVNLAGAEFAHTQLPGWYFFNKKNIQQQHNTKRILLCHCLPVPTYHTTQLETRTHTNTTCTLYNIT